MENRLTGVSGPANLSLGYDVLGRLARLTEGGRVREFLYDGARIIGEYDGASGSLVRRYVPGPGVDEHLVWYEGSGLSDRRWFHQDERGSVVAVSDGSGVLLGSWRYGPYGESGTAVGEGNNGFVRFGYTGRLRLPGTTLLHYRARVYAPDLGRFLQADPIGFASGRLNLYAYVGNDPINATDPSGMKAVSDGALEEIEINGIRPKETIFEVMAGLFLSDLLDAARAFATGGFGPVGGHAAPGAPATNDEGMEEGGCVVLAGRECCGATRTRWVMQVVCRRIRPMVLP